MKTTFNELHEWGVCTSVYRRLAKGLGCVKTYNRTATIKLSQILDICGINDFFSVIEKAFLDEDFHNELRLLSCDYAERALPFFEYEFPNDHRPRKAIDAARHYSRNEIGIEALEDAASPARSSLGALNASASDAAWAAAWAAWAVASSDYNAAASNAAWAVAWDALLAASNASLEVDWDVHWDAAFDAERIIQAQMLRVVLLKLEAGEE